MANFNKGGKSAREAVKEQAARSGFRKTNYLRLAEDESAIVRLVDDHEEWIWIHQHSFVPTKGTPPDFKSESGKKWPETMGAVCRKSKTKEGDLVFPEFDGECFICDEMTNPNNKRGKYFPQIRVWARAVLRDEIIGTKAMLARGEIEEYQVGLPVGYQDREVEIEETDVKGESTGKTKKEKEVIVLNQAMSNFFQKFQACAETYGTVLDRDYKITKVGSGKDTDFDIVPLDKIFNDDGKPYTLQDPAVRESYAKILDLEAVIEEQAADNHYDKFFDTRHPFPVLGTKDDDESKDEQKATPKQRVAKRAEPVSEPDSSHDGDMAGALPEEGDASSGSTTRDRMEAMKARLKNVSTASAD
jgi:hypothetical protein